MAKRRTKKPLLEECVPPALKAREAARMKARDAVWHLELIQYGTNIVELFKTFFPADFSMDYRTAQSVLASYNRFAELVDERLFPIWAFDELTYAYDEPSWAFETIPLRQITMTWHEKLFEGQGLNQLEELIVSHTGIACEFLGGTDLKALPAGKSFSEGELDDVCAEKRGMLAKLPIVVSAVCCNTHNAWIDLSEEEWMQGEMPLWQEQQMRWLAEEYEEAAEIERTVDSFTKWVLAKPARLKRVESLLKRSWVPNRERVRVTTKPGAVPLVEVLAA